ncbi:MAG: HD domain-containing protein [Chloroflexaceae bacterium]|nr:HD domain-containing protein [Chloroflexaceae bacterium]
MKKPDYQAVSEYARQRLKNELSPRLVYHSLAHTERDVLAAAERFAAYEGVQGEELLLLRTAVWFHDIGYVVQRANHE